MMTTDRDWPRLARAVAWRRTSLGLTQRQLARAAAVAVNTIQNLEDDTRRPAKPLRTLPKVEAALRWAAGSIDAVLDGGDPIPLEGEGGQHARASASSGRPMSLTVKRQLWQHVVEDPLLPNELKTMMLEWIDSQPTKDG